LDSGLGLISGSGQRRMLRLSLYAAIFYRYRFGGTRVFYFGLLGASHFEKLSGASLLSTDFLLRMESPTRLSCLRTVVPVRVPSHPFVRGPAGHKSFSGRWELRRIGSARRGAAEFRRIQKSYTGEDWFCGAWVARDGGPFFCLSRERFGKTGAGL